MLISISTMLFSFFNTVKMAAASGFLELGNAHIEIADMPLGSASQKIFLNSANNQLSNVTVYMFESDLDGASAPFQVRQVKLDSLMHYVLFPVEKTHGLEVTKIKAAIKRLDDEHVDKENYHNKASSKHQIACNQLTDEMNALLLEYEKTNDSGVYKRYQDKHALFKKYYNENNEILENHKRFEADYDNIKVFLKECLKKLNSTTDMVEYGRWFSDTEPKTVDFYPEFILKFAPQYGTKMTRNEFIREYQKGMTGQSTTLSEQYILVNKMNLRNNTACLFAIVMTLDDNQKFAVVFNKIFYRKANETAVSMAEPTKLVYSTDMKQRVCHTLGIAMTDAVDGSDGAVATKNPLYFKTSTLVYTGVGVFAVFAIGAAVYVAKKK